MMISIILFNGEISFKQIKVYGNIIQNVILFTLQSLLYYPKKKYNLYEKVYYAHVFHSRQFYRTNELYIVYLEAKNKCLFHKQD